MLLDLYMWLAALKHKQSLNPNKKAIIIFDTRQRLSSGLLLQNCWAIPKLQDPLERLRVTLDSTLLGSALYKVVEPCNRIASSVIDAALDYCNCLQQQTVRHQSPR